eukprot:CAMPEP_0195521520 /NCGR_PEP_ID=MMETSP0794_2-20130614/18847_1 /TAXON_ID=515487 /ORGANISM="Stephanopyxis turris, Strain CCMP 815" /LENGTH=272 /DNA_ID=CAMNT_0040651095 /DNA_START=200 /DNA_END=1015 /DNA_ORIENTATION=+
MTTKDDSKWIRFLAGALASNSAEIVTLPIDCTKVRLQSQGMMASSSGSAHLVRYDGMLDAMLKISRHEGPSTLWSGLSPALIRQVSYSSLCMVLYEPFRNAIAGSNPEKDITFLQKLAAGGIAGAISISIANPVDVIKVRMQADRSGTLYKGVTDASFKIFKSEGMRGFARGVWPNIQRGFIINAAELGTYDHTKTALNKYGITGIGSHLGASFVAGFAGAAASNPVDVLKTRLMTQPAGHRALYRGMTDCLLKTVRHEGFAALYNGFIPNW